MEYIEQVWLKADLDHLRLSFDDHDLALCNRSWKRLGEALSESNRAKAFKRALMDSIGSVLMDEADRLDERLQEDESFDFHMVCKDSLSGICDRALIAIEMSKTCPVAAAATRDAAMELASMIEGMSAQLDRMCEAGNGYAPTHVLRAAACLSGSLDLSSGLSQAGLGHGLEAMSRLGHMMSEWFDWSAGVLSDQGGLLFMHDQEAIRVFDAEILSPKKFAIFLPALRAGAESYALSALTLNSGSAGKSPRM